jgi:hypothetical protein
MHTQIREKPTFFMTYAKKTKGKNFAQRFVLAPPFVLST